MTAPLAKFIDWLAIRTGELVSPADDRRNPRLAEAIQFLNSSDFLAAPRLLLKLEFDGPENFRFPAPQPGAIAENNIAFGRLFPCGPRWENRPAVILLHGGSVMAGGKGSLSHRLFPRIVQAAFLARSHALRGYDAVQLAAAIEIHATDPSVTLLSANAELNTAALALGLLVDDPNNHP
jgi:hypothetical protein